MKNRKKIIFNGVFLAVVFALTIYGVFHGEDLSSMMDAPYIGQINGGCFRELHW